MTDDIDKLLERFREEGLSAFSDDSLAREWREAIFAPKGPVVMRERLSAQPLREAFSDLDTYLKKFSFGELSVEEWSRRYKFPNASDIRSYKRRAKRRVSANIVVANESVESVQEWIQNEVIPDTQSGRNLVRVLLGGVGSGKSTFNKYVTTVFFPTFQQAGIVCSRVEYRKLYAHVARRVSIPAVQNSLSEARIEVEIQRYISTCLFRDILHYCWSELSYGGPSTFSTLSEPFWPGLDLSGSGAQQFIEWCEQAGEDIEAAKRAVMVLRPCFNQFKAKSPAITGLWFSEFLQSDEKQRYLELYLLFCRDCGRTFFIILDGLDYIQAADFLAQTSHKTLLVQLSKWMVRGENRVRLSISGGLVPATFQITLRENTYNLLWQEYAQSLFETEVSLRYIVQPSFTRIFQDIATSNVWTSTDGISHTSLLELEQIFQEVQDALIDGLGLRKQDIDSLFLDNIRYRVHFTQAVLDEVRKDIRYEGDILAARTMAELVDQLRYAIRDLSKSRRYRLVDLLLHSRNERFAPFVRLLPDALTPETDKQTPALIENAIKDNNAGSGFVSNIFNYHIPYRKPRDTEYLLEKLRIVDLLIREGHAPLDVDGIQERFREKGWVASPYLTYSVGILVRENFIYGAGVDAGRAGYVVSPLGMIVRRKLIRSLTYVENAYFATFLPRGLQSRSIDLVRSTSPRAEWVASSIFHCWLLLRLVRTAESTCEPLFFREMRVGLLETIDRVIQADTTGSYARRAGEHISRFVDAVD